MTTRTVVTIAVTLRSNRFRKRLRGTGPGTVSKDKRGYAWKKLEVRSEQGHAVHESLLERRLQCRRPGGLNILH